MGEHFEPHHHDPESIPRVGELFNFGEQRGIKAEIIENGERHFYWKQGLYDDELARPAGWRRYYVPEGGYIVIPEGSRPASSVLAGTEVNPGEKGAVVDFLVHYASQNALRRGIVDAAASLDNLVVPRGEDRQLFLLPPHAPSPSSVDLKSWAYKTADDIDAILAPTGQRWLAHDFREQVLHMRGMLR